MRLRATYSAVRYELFISHENLLKTDSKGTHMSATLQLLASKKAQLEQELSHLEKQVSRLTISSAKWYYRLCFDIRGGNLTASFDTCSCMKKKVTI